MSWRLFESLRRGNMISKKRKKQKAHKVLALQALSFEASGRCAERRHSGNTYYPLCHSIAQHTSPNPQGRGVAAQMPTDVLLTPCQRSPGVRTCVLGWGRLCEVAQLIAAMRAIAHGFSRRASPPCPWALSLWGVGGC